MHPARIRKLAKTASELSNAGNYEAAFALRWIAYESLMVRAATKALWMRGATVREAENIIMRLPPRSPTSLLADCCRYQIDLTSDRSPFPILKRIKDRAHFRNLLFHQLNVASKRQLQLLSDTLDLTLANPKAALGDIPIKIAGLRVSLGDPLADLRKLKRRPRVKKRSVAELFPYSKSDLQTVPAIPDLTEDEVLRLFTPMAEKAALSVEGGKPRLTKEELHRRMTAWKLSLRKPNIDAA